MVTFKGQTCIHCNFACVPLDRSGKPELLIFVIAEERVEFRQESNEKTENSRYEEIIHFGVSIPYNLKYNFAVKMHFEQICYL